MPEELFSVLLADDEYWIRENLRTMLDWQAYGMRFLEPANDGEEALKRLEQETVHILITDINMPYLSGIELIEKAAELSPDTVIIVLSGYSDYEYVRESLVHGAIDYLLKPVAKAKLLDVLNQAIEKTLLNRKERIDMEQTQQSLARAASAILDRDFSNILHDARRKGFEQDMEAQLFEYEQRFSGYRLTLLHTIHMHSADDYQLKQVIEKAMPLTPKLLIHNLYHPSQFLLITEPDRQQLDKYLNDVLALLREHTGAPAQAVVSNAYLSFGDLRMAYDEVRAALLTLPIKPKSVTVFATNFEQQPSTPRISVVIQKQMEQAVQTKQRDWFERLLKQTGLFEEGWGNWSQWELLHCLNTIVWALRRSIEETGDARQLLGMDTLAELLPSTLENPDELRWLVMQMEDEAFSVDEAENVESIRDVVVKAKAYVDSHYVDEISLHSLAQRFSVDDSYLSKSFKQYVGQNLTLYIAQLRISQAKQMLSKDAMSITEVAQAVGYDDYAYFSRVFKKLVGVSPRTYREGEEEA